jgi:hydrogenase expression/formation protein HypC
MCLGVVGEVLEVDGMIAVVDFFGVKKKVRLDVVDAPVSPGDYVLNHVGFAIRRIPPEDVAATLSFYEEVLRANDLMARDMQAELEFAGAGENDAAR